MSSIILAIFGYFLTALEAIISKFLLTGKIKSWKLYVFYIGIFSLFSLVFFPLGLRWYGWDLFAISLVSGVALFVYLAMLYQVLEKQPASFVYVFSGALSIIGVLVFSELLLQEALSIEMLGGIIFLLLGGLLIAVDPSELRLIKGAAMIIGAGIVFSVHLVLLKYVYQEIELVSGGANRASDFVSGYIPSRVGEALATAAAFAVPSFRKEVFRLLGKKEKGKRAKHFLATALAKTLAGLGTLLVNVAIFWGSVTVVNALMAVQYLFIFVMSLLLTLFYKNVFGEKLRFEAMVVNCVGVILVIIGVVLVN